MTNQTALRFFCCHFSRRSKFNGFPIFCPKFLTPFHFSYFDSDTTSPSLTMFEPIVIDVYESVQVEYTITVTDAVTSPVPFVCTSSPTPALVSGSYFPIGVTTITCVATDGAGNKVEKSSTVTVNERKFFLNQKKKKPPSIFRS